MGLEYLHLPGIIIFLQKKVRKAVGKPIFYPAFTCEVSQDDRRLLEAGFLDHNIRVFLYEMVGLK